MSFTKNRLQTGSSIGEGGICPPFLIPKKQKSPSRAFVILAIHNENNSDHNDWYAVNNNSKYGVIFFYETHGTSSMTGKNNRKKLNLF